MGRLQVRLFLTYLIIIGVTLALTALSLLLLLGGYRDSITYGNLEDIGRLFDSFAQGELRAAASGPEPGPNQGNDLLLSLRSVIDTSREVGGVAPVTYLAVVDRGGKVLLHAGPDSLEGAALLEPPLVRASPIPHEPVRCRLRTPGGSSLLCVSMPLSDRVLAAFPRSEAAAIVIAEPAAGLGEVLGDLAPRLMFSGLIGVAAALVLGFLLSQSVAAPLRNIASAARSVARGNYRQRVPATGPREVRDLAANFNRMTEEVQRSQQTLRDFLANISHELKTPLTSIRGFSTAVVDGTIDSREGRDNAMRVISSESNRVLRLVEELLALSRLESGQLVMKRDPLRLSELFEHLNDVFALRSEEAEIAMEFHDQTTVPVSGDFDRLEQVLSNLLDNAFRHTPRGGRIQVKARQANELIAEVSVADSGPGISREHLPRLFERFYRGPSGESGRGYGLGLAICREIVRAHGGNIWATSEAGEGSTFTFTLAIEAQTARKAAARRRGGRTRLRTARPIRPSQ